MGTDLRSCREISRGSSNLLIRTKRKKLVAGKLTSSLFDPAKLKGENNMDNLEIELLKNRIHILTQRDSVRNAKIIKKLERKLRANCKYIRGSRAKFAYVD